MLRKVIAVFLAASFPVVGAAQETQEKSEKAVGANSLVAGKTGKTESIAPKPATDDPNYIIGPQDELNVSVWHEPDISRTVPVRPDGKISLVLLNDVQAAGLTPMQLSSSIVDRLGKFISDPQVTVIVTSVNSQRVFIVGEVLRTGTQTLLPNMTALDAISNAGGFTPFAKKTKIFILRTQDGKQISIPFNYKEVVNGRHPERDIRLLAGDKIVVP